MGDVQTKSGNNPVWRKWFVLGWLATILVIIAIIRFSNTPTATRADNDDRNISEPSDESIRSILEQLEQTTPSSRPVGHTPSLEEIVKSEFKNNKSSQIIDQISRRTLSGLQGVHVAVDSDYADQNLLDTNRVKLEVELRLCEAGINVLSKEQFLTANGWPLLLVTASVMPSQSEGSFLMIVKSLELYEQISLERSPDISLYLATWSDLSGKVSRKIGLSATARAATREIESLVEHFADDYFFINPASTNKLTIKKAQLTFTANGSKYSNDALVGLTELHVPQLYGSDISVETIIPQLEKAGIKVLSSEKWNDIQDGHYPKKPYLSLKTKVTADDPQRFRCVLPLQLIDRVTLARNHKIIRELPVWESRSFFDMGSQRHRNEVIGETKQDVQAIVDEFINAYLLANSN